MGRELHAGMCVHGNRHRLSRPHLVELRLLEIGNHPHVGIDQRQQRLTGLNIGPCSTLFRVTCPEMGA